MGFLIDRVIKLQNENKKIKKEVIKLREELAKLTDPKDCWFNVENKCSNDWDDRIEQKCAMCPLLES